MAAERYPGPTPPRGPEGRGELSSGELTVAVPPELVESIARRAAELAAELVAARPEPWVGVADAAEHIAASPSRVYALVAADRIPFQRDGSRLLFRRSALDQWIADGGGLRP